MIEVDFDALEASLQRMRALKAQPLPERPPTLQVPNRPAIISACAGCGRIAIRRRGGLCYACNGDSSSAWLFRK